jgi:hypothetical protein
VKIALLVAAVAACGGATHGSLTNASHAHVAPSGPPPSVASTGENEELDFQMTGLPAVAADGSEVVIADRAADGARGEPNLTVEAIDRHDKHVKTIDVLEPDAKFVPAKLEAANRWLGDEHQARDLRPLETSEIASDQEGQEATQWTVTKEDIVLQLRDNARLTVRGPGKTYVDRVMSDWEAGVSHRPDMDCSNPLFLENAWLDVPHRLALVLIGYHGNDTCWEPDSALHVVSW